MPSMSNPSTDNKTLEDQQTTLHQRPNCKLLAQISGAPGSGKTATANLLASRINAVVIPHDNIKSFFIDSGITFDDGVDWIVAENAMLQGLSVIVDTPCPYPEILFHGHALARKHGYRYCDIEVRSDPGNLAMLDDRLRARVDPLRVQRTTVDDGSRDADRSGEGAEIKKAAGREQFRAMIVNQCRPASNRIVVDTCRSLDERVDFILGRISTMPYNEEEWTHYLQSFRVNNK
ncbi:hypothetical protein F4777DRAFT_562485 [Nemania sp. FL0916]|nr:hypothetical protein F4777DRAFT_562485 [Nemania sp. FL0916]